MQTTAVWKGKVENDVLACLEEAYENAGYDFVYNLHRYDRTHEKGVDLECGKSAEKTVLQVKIKPAKSDSKQLRRLAHSKADKRIYIYIENPSVSFQKEIDNSKATVEFWDAEKLHDFLIKYRSIHYLRFLFLSSNLVNDIKKALHNIFSCSEISPQGLESSDLNEWWALKDRAVKMHTSLEYLESFWRDPIFTIDEHNSDEYRRILESIFFSFELIAQHSSKNLVSLSTGVRSKRPNIFSRYVNLVLAGSDWTGMGRAKSEIHNEQEVLRIIDDWIIPPQRRNTEYSQIHYYLENLHIVAKAIEDGVDWLFNEYVRSHSQATPS